MHSLLNSLRYRLLAWLLVFVLLITLFIIPTNIIHGIKEKKINRIVLSIDALYINFLKDFKTVNDFLFAEPVNANFFITGESPFLSSHLTISDLTDLKLAEIQSTQQIRQFEIQHDLNTLSDNFQRFNRLFDSLVYLVYKRGYKDYGLEGELYTYGTLLESSAELDRSVITQLRRSENDYLSKDYPDNTASIYTLVSTLKNSVAKDLSLTYLKKNQLLELITGYQNAFDRIIRLDQQTGIRNNIALKAELNKLGDDIENSLQGIVEKSNIAQKSLIAKLNMFYVGFLLIIFVLVVYFSYILSKYIVSHLESLNLYISALAKNPMQEISPIKMRNPTREIKHIYHEFRNLISQLKIREKQRDKALQHAEDSMKRYQELADMLPQSIFETDSWGNYTYANKAWFATFGYAEKDLEDGINLIETLISESKDNDILGISKIENSSFIAIRNDGTRFPASVYSDNIFVNGNIMGRRGIIVDITDKIEYIHNLQKETSKAKTSDELKSSFLANMSHEIRTPINSIIGFSNLLAVEQIPDMQKKDFINYIRSSSEILLNLVDDIIDIAKIEAGELKISKKELELRTLGEELCKTSEEVKKKYNKEHIKLIFIPEESVSKLILKTDPFRLRQIMTNLINNAIKFTDKGFVEFGYVLKDEKTIEFYVRDTGIGLSRNELDLIFERFKRARHSETKNITGTGLGLAISKNLVQLLGGEMWVDSEPEKGTVFSFTLPYIRSVNPESLNEIPHYIEEESYNWSGKKILIAEDDKSSYSFLKALLRKTHAHVLHAQSGVEVVEMCRTMKDIDLVIMDIQLPEMNGIEATRLIKEMKESLPVIAQTAFAMAGDKEKIKQAGCDDYIAKPINTSKFLSMVNHFLKPGENAAANLTRISAETATHHRNLN